jgi:hypothetical protein
MISTVAPSQGIVDKLLTFGLLGVGGFFGWKYLKNYLENEKRDKAESDVSNVPEAKHADRIFQLLHPFNDAWYSFENADEAGLIAYARNITNFKKVQEYYSKLSKGSSLLADLRSAMDSEEYDKFMNAIPELQTAKPNPNSGKTATAASTQASLPTTTAYVYESGPFAYKVYKSFKKGVKMGSVVGEMTIKKLDKSTDLRMWKVKLSDGVTVLVLKSQVILS